MRIRCRSGSSSEFRKPTPMKTESPETQVVKHLAEEFNKLLLIYGKAVSAGHHEKADAIALQLMAMATDPAMKELTRDMLLSVEASEREAKGDLIGAEAARRKLVTLQEDELHELKPGGEEWRCWGELHPM